MAASGASSVDDNDQNDHTRHQAARKLLEFRPSLGLIRNFVPEHPHAPTSIYVYSTFITELIRASWICCRMLASTGCPNTKFDAIYAAYRTISELSTGLHSLTYPDQEWRLVFAAQRKRIYGLQSVYSRAYPQRQPQQSLSQEALQPLARQRQRRRAPRRHERARNGGDESNEGADGKVG